MAYGRSAGTFGKLATATTRLRSTDTSRRKSYKRQTVEDLFENLMQYSDFNNANEIKSDKDIQTFFNSVDKNAISKGRRGIFTKKMRDGRMFTNYDLKNAVKGVWSKGFKAGVSKADVAASKRKFKSFAAALKAEETIVVDNKRIFQTIVKIKSKEVIRWRDHKGRFVKSPKVVTKTTQFGGTRK